MTNTIKQAIAKLKFIAITGKGTEQEIKEMTDAANTATLELAKNINSEWFAAINTNDIKPFRIQSGTNKRNMAENKADMLNGALNRMHVTDNKTEFDKMLHSALYHINALSQHWKKSVLSKSLNFSGNVT